MLTLVANRLQEAMAELNTPAEPTTVGEFVKATLALSEALAAAQERIRELEAVPVAKPAEVEAWQRDWHEMNLLLSEYAVGQQWCSEYDRIIATWNERFQAGYLLNRSDTLTRNREYPMMRNRHRDGTHDSLSTRRAAARDRHQQSL